jgi:hypothetical protein
MDNLDRVVSWDIIEGKEYEHCLRVLGSFLYGNERGIQSTEGEGFIGRTNPKQKYGYVPNESLGEATVHFPQHVVLHRVGDNCMTRFGAEVLFQ